MPITALPTPPLPTDTPADFNTKAFALLGALPTFVTEANALETAVDADATTATTQANLATTQANSAATSANTASTKATEASNSAAAAETSRIEASKLNLGSKTTAPALDNQGEPLLAGCTYYDTTLSKWRVWTGASWGDGISAGAGVSSFNGMTGNVVYEVPEIVQLTKPVNVSPATAVTDIVPPTTLVAERSLSLYGTPVESRFEISTTSDFTSGVLTTAWITSDTSQVSYTVSLTDVLPEAVVYYWRVQSKTVVDGITYTSPYSAAFTFTTSVKFFSPGDADALTSLVTIQAEYNPATTYSAGDIVIVRKSPLRFIEYKSLVSSNTGNAPETSPAQWEFVYDNNIDTSGYFGEVLGSACVVDKGEWLPTTAYSIGDMVVVKKIATPLKQSDLTAYVALTANTGKNPSTNPSDWQQRNGLPTGTSLAANLGIASTAEVLQNKDSGWLKFVHKGVVKYIAKKTFMRTVSWNDLAKAEAVYGNRTVRIGSNLFKVSILTGAEADPTTFTSASTATNNKGAGSEWNELIYRVHATVPTDGTAVNHGGKQIGSNWKDFTDTDLNTTGSGAYTWCQEAQSSNLSTRVIRGSASLSYFSAVPSSVASTTYGWRPCLTLISEPEANSNLYGAEASGVGPSVASLQYDPITDTGFYGEVLSSELYTGSSLSTAIGLTEGTIQFDTDPWLKFYWHGMVLYVSKKPYRHTVSWDAINTANAVYGVNLGSTGRTRLTKGSIQLDVKILKGATADASPAISPGRQWDELIYRVAAEIPTGQIGGNWASYTDTDLQITGNGGSTWCQEIYKPTTSDRVLRGIASLSYFSANTYANAGPNDGWRPCLALVR